MLANSSASYEMLSDKQPFAEDLLAEFAEQAHERTTDGNACQHPCQQQLPKFGDPHCCHAWHFPKKNTAQQKPNAIILVHEVSDLQLAIWHQPKTKLWNLSEQAECAIVEYA